MIWKLAGLLRDIDYFLFKKNGWKWVFFLAVIIQLARCSIIVTETSLFPSCTFHEIEISKPNELTIKKVCKITKKEKDFICQLLQLG